jgi:2-methylisocitrate lyase-like PEP mutase family enzyme
MNPNHAELVAHFRQLHTDGPLILPNAWDAASARIIEQAGALAIATTSAGIAWAHGCADGQKLERDRMITAIREIVEAVKIPVTADIEGGYGTGTADDVTETVKAVITAGAVGINLEDSPGRDGQALLSTQAQVLRIQAAREAARGMGVDLLINARSDVFLAQVGLPETRLDETVRRANAYRTAGADCLFIPGVIDATIIQKLVQQIDGPINIMAKPGAPNIPALVALGVARVSVGSAIAAAAMAATQRAALELLDTGTYHELEVALTFADANGLFSDRPFLRG